MFKLTDLEANPVLPALQKDARFLCPLNTTSYLFFMDGFLYSLKGLLQDCLNEVFWFMLYKKLRRPVLIIEIMTISVWSMLDWSLFTGRWLWNGKSKISFPLHPHSLAFKQANLTFREGLASPDTLEKKHLVHP